MASGGCWGAPESISTAWDWAASAALVYCRGEIFSIPREVVKATNDADQFYRLAVTLKQVANFYNSIGAQMLEVQKPMLIEDAKAFEAAINQQDKSIAWSNVAALEAYISRLQAAA